MDSAPRPNRFCHPFTFTGVANYAWAQGWRFWLTSLVLSLLAGALTVWLLLGAWTPIFSSAISQLPETAAIENGRLIWSAKAQPVLAQGPHLSVMVDPHRANSVSQSGDVQVELGDTELHLRSFIGEFVWPYPPSLRLDLSRAEVEPWWGAWSPIVLAGAFAATFLSLQITWLILGTVQSLFVRLLAFYLDRRVNLGGAWRVGYASVFPGALVMCMGLVLYLHLRLSLFGLMVFLPMHLMVNWIFMVGATFRLPTFPDRAASVRNPFHTEGTEPPKPTEPQA
jgi:hypothetical protein